MSFKHYIITRLMLNIGEEKDQEYLDYRAELFNNFFLKSMLSQTNKNFENIFLIDPIYENLDYSKFKFEDLNYKIIISDKHPRDLDMIDSEEYKYIITTRMDSDDIIADYFIESVQNVFLSEKKEGLVDYNLVGFVTTNLESYAVKSYECNSMFLSTIFRSGDYNEKGCYVDEYSKISKHFHNKYIINNFGAACICHDHNMSNSIDSGLKINRLDLKKYFKWI